jgi:hypothetical protein
MRHDELPPLDAGQLTAVTGGQKTIAGDSGGATDQILQMVTALMNSIKQLQTNQGQNDPLSQILPIMMMMGGGLGGKSQGPPPPAPAPAPAPPPGDGWKRVI